MLIKTNALPLSQATTLKTENRWSSSTA